jgi:hypothetical protein
LQRTTCLCLYSGAAAEAWAGATVLLFPCVILHALLACGLC